jgi:hypothetical protein
MCTCTRLLTCNQSLELGLGLVTPLLAALTLGQSSTAWIVQYYNMLYKSTLTSRYLSLLCSS